MRESETQKESFYVREQTNPLRKGEFGDVQVCYKMEETAVTHGSFSDSPMEAKTHKLMLIERPTV